MNYNRAALKQAAKQTIRETRPKVWVVTLVYILLASFLPMVVSNLIPNPISNLSAVLTQHPELVETHPEYILQLAASSMGGGTIITFFVSVVISLYRMVMNYGYVGYSLKVHRRQSTGYGDLFGGFSVAGKAIGASIMVAIFTFLWSLLLMLGYGLLLVLAVWISHIAEFLAFILIIAAIVFLVVGVLCISCRYALTPYYIMTQPDMGIMEAITASKTAMRGNVWKRVVLELSFLGWQLLIVLILWVILLIGALITFAGSFAALEAGMIQGPFNLLAMGGTMILFIILAFVASLPLNLWLTGYMNVSYAAFFDYVAGVTAPAPTQAAPFHYNYGGVPPIPPQPPAPDVPPMPGQAPNVPPVGSPVEPPIPGVPPVEPPLSDIPPVEPPVSPAEPPVAEETPDVPQEPSQDDPETPSQPEE